MSYRILFRSNRPSSSFFYFSHFDASDPSVIHGKCAHYRGRSVLYPSISSALVVVKKIDPVLYSCYICRDIDSDDVERDVRLSLLRGVKPAVYVV